MFASSTNTPFGTGTGFGTGTTFGSQNTTTQFGASAGTNLFGNKTQTGFGTTFNQPQSSGTGSLFGSTTTNTAGSLFGGTATGSIFGQQPTTQSSFGFGSSGSSLFGNAAKSSTGTSVFQAPGQTSTFGTGTSTAFGTAAGSGLFGGGANKSTGLFGGTGQKSSTLFGQKTTTTNPGFQGILGTSGTADKGTPVKFSVVQGNDSMVKNGITTNVSVRHQCITVMSNYDKKSIEELRIEDYEAGRKTGATGSTGFAGLSTSTSTGGLFGNTSATGFGGSASLLGQKQTAGFGTSGSLFGSSAATPGLFGQQQATATAFGQKPGGLFVTPTSSTTGAGFGTGFGTGLFGQSTSGQTTGLFGATTTSAGSSLFGAQSTGFGQSQTGTAGLFGQTGFGIGQQQQATAFGAKPFGTALGTGATGGLFGAQNKPQTGFNFGGGTTGLGTSAFNAASSTPGGLFGAKATAFGGTAFGANTGTGLFGTTGALGTGTGLNAGTLGTGTFGALGSQQTTGLGITALGSNQNTALNALQLQQQQQQLLEQQLLILSNSPFGDSPLFRNSLVERVRPERASGSTSTSLSRTSTTPSHYKVSPRPASRIKPRPINNHTMNKSKLFEGLDEDSGLSPDTFVPRKNIKKLVLKPKSGKEGSPLPAVDTTRVKLHSLEDEDLPVTLSSSFPPSPPQSQDTSPMRGSPTPRAVQERGKAADALIDTSDGVSPMGVRFSRTVGREAADTTISELNARRMPIEVEDKLRRPVVDEDGSSETTARELCGIILKRSEYYTIPPLAELNQKIDSNGDVFVDDFVVGREGYGQVKFYGRTNVAGLNLDEIVFFRRREIEVYPDSYPNKPPVGEELNKKAEITLEKVWPNDKTSHRPITSPERLNLLGWQKRVETATEKLGASFLNYDLDKGNWVFTVEHFTRYGMHQYVDDDDSAAKKLKRPPIKPHLQQEDGDSVEKEKLEIFRHLQEKKQQFEAYEKEKQRAALSLRDQDSDMPDIDHETFPEEMLDGAMEEEGEGDLDNSPASHQLAAALGMNAHRIQVMKASFFADQSQLSPYLPRDAPTVDKTLFSGSFGKAGHSKSSIYPAVKPLGPLLSPKVTRCVDDSGQLSQSLFGSPKIGVYPLRHPVIHDITPAAPSSPMMLPSSIGSAMDIGIKVVGSRNQFGLVPKKDSLVNGKENLIADAGLMMGRSFRVGWGPGFVLVHSGTPLGKPETKPAPTTQSSLVGDFLTPKLRPITSEGSPSFGVTLEKLDVASHPNDRTSDTVLAHHQSVLEAELQHAVVSIDDGCPFFQSSTDVKGLHHHAEVARRNKEATDPGPLREAAEQICLVWDLVVALWGKLKEDGDDDEEGSVRTAEDRESYQCRVARKAALSNWLAEAAKERISQEVDEANFQESDHVKSIFSYMTGKQISKACHVAQQHGDYRLSLLLSQVTGNSVTRNLLYKQLADWQELKADLYINAERIKIYALLAGAMVWDISRDTANIPRGELQSLSRHVVNVCEGLDWKRVLAVHLWYYCSPTSSIADALKAYDASFKGSTTNGRYGAPPHPPFMDDEDDDDTDEENKFVTRDTCYHLLKLYCKRSHRLERLLSPSTSTALQLDFRLSWHLYQVLQSLEYTHLSQEHAGMLHSGFAAQLEGLGLWHWAAFVLLHIQEPVRRERAVRSLLCRYCSLSADHTYVEKERFMLDDLKIPTEWIHEAKALRARYEGRTREEAFHLVKARHWSLGHNVILRSLASDAIINAEYDVLKTLLGELEPRDRSSLVRDWATGGQVFLDYLALVQKFQDITKESFVPTKYDWEDIHVEVSSLCTRIKNLPSDTPKNMLCQYDMAKMCANFLKIVMNELADLTDESEPFLPTHVLVPQVTKLPMPEDCTLGELRQLIPSYITEITAGF